MRITFINREKEMKALEDVLKKDNSFIVIYGRRRIGKTELIKQILKNEDNKMYVLCEEGYRINLLFLEDMLAKKTGINIRFNSYRDLFNYLRSTNKRWVIVLDEFQNIIEKRAILSEFQYIVDEVIKNSKIHLIVLGSSISLMKSFLEYRSPLYGRRDLSINLGELKFKDMKRFNKLDIEENIKIYGVTGGVPLYIQLFSSFKDIKKLAFSKNGFLYEEVEFILGMEFKEYRVYKLILSALAKGKNTFNEIANYTGIQKTNLYIYLESLMNVNFIKKEIPITKTQKTKNVRYFIKDNYLNFYFTFIEKFKHIIEMNDDIDMNEFHKEYNKYLGKVFERVALQTLLEIKPTPFTNIGKWWHKDKEIDIVVINEQKKEMLAVEVKWRKLKIKEVKKIIKELENKVEHIAWHQEDRKVKLGIFAKKLDKEVKGWLNEQGHYGWDLEIIKML